MPLKAPAALEAVFQHITTQAPRGTYVIGQRWPKFSEEVRMRVQGLLGQGAGAAFLKH